MFSFDARAKINYVSLHDVLSKKGEPLSLKLNIVEEQPNATLQFVLEAQGDAIVLDYQRLNQFMLKLSSINVLIGQGIIHIYELNNNRWTKVKLIKLPKGSGLSATSLVSNSANVSIEDKKPEIKIIKEDCVLNNQPEETLWHIASRYEKQWKTNIYGAMVAIYNKNVNKFFEKNIEKLITGSILLCPSNKALQLLGDKIEMKAIFNNLKRID